MTKLKKSDLARLPGKNYAGAAGVLKLIRRSFLIGWRPDMRLSFDLDDTLICYQQGVPREPSLAWYWGLWTHDEPLRRGARDLMNRLRRNGWELWVYTTSHRSPWSVKSWLWGHGVRVAGVINQYVHEARLRRNVGDYPPSKNPAAFGIALHVDDSDGVRMEGDQHGFSVVVIDPEDNAWTEKVLSAANQVLAGGKLFNDRFGQRRHRVG
jgi:hypothetical protein